MCRAALTCATSAADHHAGKRSRRFLARIAGAGHLAVAQHRGAIADALHFLQPVADVEHGAAFGLQLCQRFEQPVGLLRRQNRGRFIQDDQLGILQQRPDDLDALALADGQIRHMRVRIERQAIGSATGDAASSEIVASETPGSSDSAMFSATVSASNSEKCWNTMPMPSLARRAGTGDADRLALPEDLVRRSVPERRTAFSPESICRHRFRPEAHEFRPGEYRDRCHCRRQMRRTASSDCRQPARPAGCSPSTATLPLFFSPSVPCPCSLLSRNKRVVPLVFLASRSACARAASASG